MASAVRQAAEALLTLVERIDEQLSDAVYQLQKLTALAPPDERQYIEERYQKLLARRHQRAYERASADAAKVVDPSGKTEEAVDVELPALTQTAPRRLQALRRGPLPDGDIIDVG